MSDLNLKLVVSGSNDGAIRALNQVVSRARASGAALDQADARGQFGKTRAGVESISRQLGNLQRLAAVAIPANLLAGLAADAARGVDQMKAVDARLKMASRSWQDYAQAMVGVRQIAFDSGTALAVNVDLVNRIAEPIQRMGGLQTDVLATTAAVNNSLRIQNTSATEAAGSLLQFSQAMGSGVLRGDELNSVLEGMPRLARAIADGLGVTISQLRQLGAEGALTSQQVLQALQSQQAKLAEEAARMPVTVGQAWTNATEGIKVYLSEMDRTNNVTGSLASAINVVAQNIPMIADGLAKIAIIAGVALGAKLLAGMRANIAATREKIIADQLAAQSAVRHAQTELAVQQAMSAKAAAELRAVVVTQSYTLATNEAAAAAARRAAAERMAAANQGVMAATGALAVARSAQAAASVGLLGRAMSGAAVAGRGLLALFGGPLGLAVTAITAAALAWDFFSSKTRSAEIQVQVSVDEMIQRFTEFASKAGPAELADEVGKLRQRAAELREELQNPGFRQSDIGRAAAVDLRKLDDEIERTDKRLKAFKSELVAEKGLLGLGSMQLGTGGLIDQKSLDALNAFDKLYKAFASGATNENGRLTVSAIEARTAIDSLLSSAKTPAEFSGLAERLSGMLSLSSNASLRSQLEVAIEGRMRAEMQALATLVTGLEARSARTRDLFSASAQNMLAQFNQAAALARVIAELRNDARGASAIDVGLRNAGTGVAVQQAQLEMKSVELVAARKRELVADQSAAVKASADAEIAAAKAVMETKLAAFQKEVDAGRRTEAQLKDQRETLQREFLRSTAGAAAARGQAETDAARQVRQVDAESARERARIAQQLYQTIQGRAAEALAQYKTYAAQVINLDKSIANNRLDTMSAIGQLQRQDMLPIDQVRNMRNEMARLKQATEEAMAAGQQDYALELLQRQKALASQIGSVRGEGIDPARQAAAGINELKRAGAEADSILQQQRAAAAAAAKQQLDSYQQMVQSLNELAKQITTLNEQAVIKLKPEIDPDALAAAVAAVQQAFATAKVQIQVAAAAAGGDIPGRAYGGLIPGSSPHDRADNILIAATAHEFMVQRPIVRQPGALAFLDDFNRRGMAALADWGVRGYAYGGLIAGGMSSRLQVPRISGASISAGAGEPAIFDLGELGKVRARTSPATAADVAAVMRRAALQFGRR